MKLLRLINIEKVLTVFRVPSSENWAHQIYTFIPAWIKGPTRIMCNARNPQRATLFISWEERVRGSPRDSPSHSIPSLVTHTKSQRKGRKDRLNRSRQSNSRRFRSQLFMYFVFVFIQGWFPNTHTPFSIHHEKAPLLLSRSSKSTSVRRIRHEPRGEGWCVPTPTRGFCSSRRV